jgi:adenylate cyclase
MAFGPRDADAGDSNRAPPLDRRPTVRQPEQRPRARLFRGRDHRRSHDRPLASRRQLRHRPQHSLHLQGQGGGREGYRTRPRRALRTRREREGAGEAITINSQLVSTETGAQVWADRFEGDRAQLGKLQVEVVARLANSLGIELVRAEALRATRERSENPDAVDLAMRGRIAQLQFSATTHKDAIDDYERALKLDPNLVRARFGLSAVLTEGIMLGFSADARGDAMRAEKLADEALSAEPGNAYAHYVKAYVQQPLIITGLRRPPAPQWESGIAEADTAISIDRNLAPAHEISGYWRVFLGRAGEGIAGVETAIRLSPHAPGRPFWEFELCHLHTHLAHWQEAIEHCRLAIQGAPNFWYPYADVAAANAWLGRDAEAKAALADLLKLKPDMTAQAYLAAGSMFSENAVFAQQIARMVEGMRKAGLPEGDKKTN